MRTKWVGVRATEVLFRDSAHGFLAWAAASVLGAILLASPASSILGGTLSGATQATANAAQSSPMDRYVDNLLRSDNPASSGQQAAPDARAEMVRLFTTSFRNGNDLGPNDRAYVAKVVAARTGLSQADAEKRVNDVTAQVKADLDRARKAAMKLAIWLTLSLFIGAFSSIARCHRGRRIARRHLEQEYLKKKRGRRPLKGENPMPILLWLLGIPIPLIILINAPHERRGGGFG